VKIERELDRLVQALMDGVPACRVKEKMTDLENRKLETEARIKDATDNPVLIHPNMANYYRDQIGALREALGDEHAQVQASEIIRKLVDKIVLVPGTDDEGNTSLSIDLHGHLAGILSLATKAKRPLHESGQEVGYTKLVAGTGNTRWLRNKKYAPPRLLSPVSQVPMVAEGRNTRFLRLVENFIPKLAA